MSRKSIFLILFFVLLVFAFYFALGKIVPGFGEKQVPPLGYVQPFAFKNQDGKIITEKDVAGKVYVAEYFFTTCTAICPRMNNNMRQVYERFKDSPGFLILSHTCNPGTDSVPVLKHYADSMQVNTTKWMFLTGRKDSLYKMARVSYKIDDPNNNVANIDDDFLHTQFWALVDKNGAVKKVYDGLKQKEITQMINDIGDLLKEGNK